MRADQRIVGRAEQVRAEGKTYVVDEVMPLTGRAAEEHRAECDREGPPEQEGPRSRVAQRGHRQVDREAARQETDREDDRGVKDLIRQRTRQALPDVEEGGDDEEREDRRLGGDRSEERRGGKECRAGGGRQE